MRVTNQGGSLAGFVIIGVLLTLVLVGGLYGLNRYNAQKAAEEVATSEEASRSPESATPEEKVTTDKEAEGRERTGTTATPGTSTDNKPQTATPAPAPVAKGGAATEAQLPTTGPADVLGSFVALGLLTFVGAHYALSRSRS